MKLFKMLPPTRYPNADYRLEAEFSDELRYHLNIGSDVTLRKLRIATIAAPVVALSSVFFGIPILVATGLALFALFVLIIIRIQKEGDALSASCPSCEKPTVKEVHANIEYVVCHDCKAYGIGRDWS